MNQIFPTTRVDMLSSNFNWQGSTVYAVALSDTLEQFDIDSLVYEYYSDLPAELILDDSQQLTSNVVSPQGVAKSGFIIFQNLSSGSGEVKSLILFDQSGDPETSRLIAYMDTGQDIPFSAAGGQTTIEYTDLGAGGFFRA